MSITRRAFFFGCLAPAFADTLPTFEEAYDDPAKQDLWLQSIPGKPYATLIIASRDYAAELGEVQGSGEFAATSPSNPKLIGKGTTSTIAILPSVFDKKYAHIKPQLGIIVENLIKKHELLHAQHFYQGIAGYPQEIFQQDTFNYPLHQATSELLCLKSEFDGLIIPDVTVQKYAQSLHLNRANELRRLVSSSPDLKLINRIEIETRFSKVSPRNVY